MIASLFVSARRTFWLRPTTHPVDTTQPDQLTRPSRHGTLPSEREKLATTPNGRQADSEQYERSRGRSCLGVSLAAAMCAGDVGAEKERPVSPRTKLPIYTLQVKNDQCLLFQAVSSDEAPQHLRINSCSKRRVRVWWVGGGVFCLRFVKVCEHCHLMYAHEACFVRNTSIC